MEFKIKGYRRQNKIFMQMESFLRTRCADQCRSHHQKVELEAKSQDIDEIINFMIERLNKKSEIKKKFEEKLEKN